jgi:hypothetical protein
LTLTAAGVAENLFYRQYLVVARAGAYLDYLKGKKEWGAMEKRGFAKAEQAP